LAVSSRADAGDRRLQGEAPRRAGCQCPGRRREPLEDGALVPPCPVLICEEQEPTLLVGAGGPAGVREKQQTEETAGLGLLGQQRGQCAGEVKRPVAQVLPDECVPLAGGVARAEEQMDGGENAVQSLGQLDPVRHPVGDACFGDLLLGTGDPRGHRRLGHEEGACDIGGGNTADQAEREGDSRLGCEGGVATREHQSEAIIRHGVTALLVDGIVRVDARGLHEKREFAPEGDFPAQTVERLIPCGRRQPGARPLRDAVPSPGLQRADVGLLRALLREIQVAGHAHCGGQHEGPLRAVGLRQRGNDRVRLPGGRGRLVARSDQNGFVVGSTTGRTSTPPPGAGQSFPISTAWSRSRASTT